MPTPADIQRQREAFYGRADTQNLAPLWTRLKSLVPPEPTPVGLAHRWAYSEVRPYVLESAALITAEEAERRVLILENPGLRGQSHDHPVAVRRAAADHARRGGARAPPHAVALRFVVDGEGAYTAVDGERTHDGAGRLHHHADLDLARPRQPRRAAGGLARRAGHPDRRAASARTFREDHLPRGAAITRPGATRWRATAAACCRSAGAAASLNSPVFNYPYGARARRCLRWPVPARRTRIRAI